MKSPKLYSILKLTLKHIINHNGNIHISDDEKKRFKIKQQDNMLFRQVRIITETDEEHNRYVVFVDCKGWSSREKELRTLLKNGFYINGTRFLPTEKSASMSRSSVMGFIDANVKEELDRRISMDMHIDTTVVAKWLAYRGLFFSGCFCIEDWYPNIVVVDDYSKTIPNQRIKYLVDREKELINRKTGEPFIWKEKGIEEGVRDVNINLWDGSGIHSPKVTEFLKAYIRMDEQPTSVLWRMPYGKGMTHEIDFVKWFDEHNIENKTVTDIFGKSHPVETIDMIVTKSFYKGYKYFQKHKDIRDWEYYWEKFRKYNHCMGVSSWNYSFETEPRMKEASYQILQDLELDFDDFVQLADYSKEWVEKIINGDEVYTNCFLGMFADRHKPENDYIRAALKNQEMLKEESVRNYLIDLLKKKFDEMKRGKLYLSGSFRFLVTDLVMFLEYISNMPLNGALKENEFYSKDWKGTVLGERIIERNPHISKEEHLVLQGSSHPLLEKYCGHLPNVCQVNGYSLCMPRLNGADEDGDRVFVIDNDLMKKGIIRDIPIVIDIEDKITAKEEKINDDTITESTIRSMVSLVGKISNYATYYHNKTPQTEEQKNRYLEYINILSVVNGKSIDYSKTGVLFPVPRHISKGAKNHPYFMKYASPYYRNKSNFSRAYSNMNRLAWHIEKWQKQFRFKRKYKDFDYEIMMNKNIPFNQNKFDQLDSLFNEYCKEMRNIKSYNAYENEREFYQDYYYDSDWSDFINTRINWRYYYEKYLELAKEICQDPKERANYVVELCYKKYPNRNKKFIWIVASDGIIDNLEQKKVTLPIESDEGKYEYLGRYYDLVEVDNTVAK